MEVAIHDATEGDARGVAALLSDLGYPATTEGAAAHVYDPASRLQVADDRGTLVGLVATHIVPRLDGDQFSCRITDIVVSARHRRRGIGAALMAAAEAEARRWGARRLDLSSGEWRTEAYAFYASMGFETSSRGFTRQLR